MKKMMMTMLVVMEMTIKGNLMRKTVMMKIWEKMIKEVMGEMIKW